MHKFGTNPWKLSFKNISLDALVLKEYDIFGLLHIYIYIFWLQNMVTISDSGAGPKRSAPACLIINRFLSIKRKLPLASWWLTWSW